ncbi:hypothetical protein GDO78_019995 [Eleutherodactylus coqui]|uniref:Uncharacterized protein n=1 Tax=Eleutherodactylus coqui TaxID=57060 RepID=A0A8J6E8Z0_ELECQ|nr:hypothetical protein GDO78_019995 [Eleutherodactylus coqui]
MPPALLSNAWQWRSFNSVVGSKKMSRVKNVREALCALCRVLSSLDSYWDPEMFRKSKFNSPEAASKFWNLLFHLLEQIFSSKPNSSPSTYETFNMGM